MKLSGVTDLVKIVFEFLNKTSRSGEKEQEIQEKKIDIFQRCIVIVTLVLLGLIVLDNIFSLQISEWIYNTFQHLIKYMTA